MSKYIQDPLKPTTKESYAMQKSQTSNRFEVLGKTPKPSSSNPSNFAYYTKESRLLLQILEADHISASGSIATKKIFQNEKYFISNEILKTRRFYEFILVDTKSVQISHVKNPKGNDIAYSKCKILKILTEKDWDQNPLLIKDFLKTLILKPLIFMITKMHGIILFVLDQTLIPGFLTGAKKYKKAFQTGFRNGGFLWVPPQTFFVLKLVNHLNILKPTMRAISLLHIVTHYFSVLNLESLGFYVGNFVLE